MEAGGRIGAVAVLLGVLINIKPVCEFVDGEVRVEQIAAFNNSLGITVGAHSGPGSIGIGFVEY